MKLSVIIVNWNGAKWIPACLTSLQNQTLPPHEIIVVDNASTDCSRLIAESLFPVASVIPMTGNYGFSFAANCGAHAATGDWLIFLNADTWLESDCLAKLAAHAQWTRATAIGLAVFDYDSDQPQSQPDTGFDIFGSQVSAPCGRQPLFTPGNFYAVRATEFRRLGGFDNEFFLYGEELDLSWRIHLTGGSIERCETARLHHVTGPRKTSQSKRYHTNRNHLLTLLKYRLPFLPAVLLQLAEGLFWTIRTGNPSAIWWTSIKPLAECFRLRRLIKVRRASMKQIQTEKTLAMLLRWFNLRIAHAKDLRRALEYSFSR